MVKLDSKVDDVFADMDAPQRPGAALLVIDRDGIVYKKCYGLAVAPTLFLTWQQRREVPCSLGGL